MALDGGSLWTGMDGSLSSGRGGSLWTGRGGSHYAVFAPGRAE